MRLWPSILIVTIIVISGFLSLYLRTAQAPKDEDADSTKPRITAISYDRVYQDGGYEVTGEVTVTDRCLDVTATGVFDASSDTIRIDLANNPTEGPCLALSTEVSFSVFVEAPVSAKVSFVANGIPMDATQGDDAEHKP